MAEKMKKQRKLVLENGREYVGTGFGADRDALCELVFDTSMVGYQEIVTDPSYTDQIVMMTYPVIGNYGITDEDYESRTPMLGGLVVREYCDTPSNFRYTKTLAELLEENNIPGLEGIDTREVSTTTRDQGVMKALICDADVSHEEAMQRIATWKRNTDLVQRISCKKKWYARTPNPRYSVVAVDCGVRASTIRALNELGCNVTVVPYDTDAETILACKPDGVLISDGPGSPADVPVLFETIRILRGRLPIFGMCMGCSFIAMAGGAKIGKLVSGHHGANQSVRERDTGKVVITTQNHEYAVDAASAWAAGFEVTHVNLLDGSVEGVACMKDRIFGLYYQPDTSSPVYKQFIQMMEEGKRNA